MPQTPTAKKLLRKFEEEYGSKKGKSVFWAKTNKSKKFAKTVGER